MVVKLSNSRAPNTTIQAYVGVTFQEIDDTVEKALHTKIEYKIENKKSDYQKYGEWFA
jgi:hypothetical protein